MEAQKKPKKTVKELSRDVEQLTVTVARLEERVKTLEKIVWAAVLAAITAIVGMIFG